MQFNVENKDEHEHQRLVTMEGIVIRQLAFHDAELLFPDGTRAHFSKRDLEWRVVNNKGKVRSFKDGKFTNLPSIPTAVETDAATGA